MKKLIFTIGISGSGKSTWTKEFIKTNENYVCANRDRLRDVLIPNHIKSGWWKKDNLTDLENTVTQLQQAIVLDSNFNVIVENTNVNLKILKRNINLYMELGLDVSFKLFDCDLKLAKQRVYLRDYFKSENFSDEEHLDFSGEHEVQYIDNHYIQYLETVDYLKQNHLNKIM